MPRLILAAMFLILPLHGVAQTPADEPSDFGLGNKPQRRIGYTPRDDDLTAVVRICLGKDGAITNVALVKGTGDVAEDQRIIERLKKTKVNSTGKGPPCSTINVREKRKQPDNPSSERSPL